MPEAVRESRVPSPESRPLQDLHVLVTRPAAQAEAQCRLLQQQGAVPLRLPLFAIERAADSAEALARLEQSRAFDWWIFTSANAVAQAVQLDRGSWPRLAAVGAATAGALSEAGRGAALVPAGGDGGQALLNLPQFAAPRGQRILIATGADSLPQLAAGLHARGAEVVVLELYRRVALPHTGACLQLLLGSAQAAIVTSGAGLRHLYRLTPPAALPALLRLQLVLPSARVVELARALGFIRAPLLPARVSDADFVEALKNWRLRRPDARTPRMPRS